jgi:hypothetical protein
LIPAISVVAAVALGVSVAFVSARFASATPAPSAQSKIDGILAPVLIGTGTTPGGASVPSKTIGHEKAAPVVSDPHGTYQAFLHRLRAADPAGEHTATSTGTAAATGGSSGGSGGSGSGTPAGDDCSPPSGNPPSGCPAGVTGAVYADLHDRPLSAAAMSFPPTLTRYEANGNPIGALYCPAASLPADEIPFDVMTTVVASSISIVYWPGTRYDLRQTKSYATSVPDANAHGTALASAHTLADVPPVENCTSLSDLTADTEYTATVTVNDNFGNTVTLSPVYFNSSDAPVVPTVRVITVGDNGIIVQSSHRDNQTAESRVYAGTTPDLGTCDQPTGSLLYSSNLNDLSLSAAELASYNQDVRYDRVQQSYTIVPEGTHLLVCERLFVGAGTPSWTRTSPQFESWISLETPDRILPTVTVTESTPGQHNESVRVTAHTIEGQPCGGVASYTPATSATASQDLCAASELAGDGDTVSNDDLVSLGFSGDIAIDTHSTWGSSSADNEQTLRLSSALCRGNCALPIADHYVMPLNDSANGQISILVTWSQGNTDGRSSWSIGQPQQVVPATLPASRPQLDTDTVFTYEPLQPDFTLTADYALHADRTVDYTLTLVSEGGDPTCHAPGATLTASGHAAPTATIRISGLCAGVSYAAMMTLVDAHGARSAWGFFAGETDRWGPSSIVSTPAIPITLRYQLNAPGPSRSFVSDLSISLDALGLGATNARGGSCSDDGIVFDTGSVSGEMSSQPTLYATLRMSPSRTYTSTDCNRDLTVGTLMNIAIPLSPADLLSLDGVVVTDPHYNFTLHLWADHR